MALLGAEDGWTSWICSTQKVKLLVVVVANWRRVLTAKIGINRSDRSDQAFDRSGVVACSAGVNRSDRWV